MKFSITTFRNQEPPEQVIHDMGKNLVDDEDFDQFMTVNVKPTSAQVKGTTRVTLNERQQKKYSFIDVDVPNMLKELLEANHPFKKCFVLKEKIIQHHEEGKIEFEEDVASSNLTSATMASQFNMMDITITFGSFDPITLAPSRSKTVDF
ncbi:hypothetical protein Goklo_015916 [Gossypium klotzschianum]|uniref:Uncharacterized protein n=1 Tax=Gossypium klotzschianum TaxID=34286 RepID=A0A7J8UCI3_9ROSI|nr:hypothetical protein [Gossypium klotzschianum]